jgi:hypothetical protein
MPTNGVLKYCISKFVQQTHPLLEASQKLSSSDAVQHRLQFTFNLQDILICG